MRDLAFSLLIMIATPLLCVSSLPEYKIVIPWEVDVRPEPVHRHSLMPRMSKLYLCISLVTWAVFDVSYMVRTFHVPRRILVLGLRKLSVALLTSLEGLSSEEVMLPGCRLKFSTRSVVGEFVVVAVSVTRWFLHDWVVSPMPNPQPGGPVWPLTLNLSGLVEPARSRSPRRHSSWGPWGAQAYPPTSR
jgi:hypothetical protein